MVAASAGEGGASRRWRAAVSTSSGMLSSTGRRSASARRKRPRGVRGGALAGMHPLGQRAHGLGQPRLIEPEVRPQRRGRRLAGDQQQRRARLGRLRQPRHRVGEAGALMHAAHADAPAHPRVPVGHADRPALVAGVVERHARRVHRQRGDEVAAPEHAERVAHAQLRQRAADDLGGVHSSTSTSGLAGL